MKKTKFNNISFSGGTKVLKNLRNSAINICWTLIAKCKSNTLDP